MMGVMRTAWKLPAIGSAALTTILIGSGAAANAEPNPGFAFAYREACEIIANGGGPGSASVALSNKYGFPAEIANQIVIDSGCAY
ncbi:hypothetical protein [Nocardia sp. NPDC004722]